MRARFLFRFLFPCLIAFALSSPLLAAKAKTAAEPQYSQRADIKAWAVDFGTRQDIDPKFLLHVLKDAKAAPRIIELMDAPVKAPPLWFEYAPRFLNENRISGGVDFWTSHEAILTRATAFFSVSPEIIVAIIGIETHYGRNVGGFRVLDALATLAFDYPRRADYFRGELEEYFLLTLDNNLTATSPKGSYAGAMGIAQFMPRSYRHYAVDFDGDGEVNLWKAPDAIGSVAYYLQEHGWQYGAPILTPVQVPKDATETVAPYVDNGLSSAQPWKDWKALGVELIGNEPAGTSLNLSDDQAVSLLKLETETGAAYFLAHDNFRVILRYNKSRLYGSAVAHLAAALKARRPVITP